MSSKYIKLFQTHSEYTAFTSTADFILPNVSYCKDQTDVVHYNPFVDYSNDYLTFIALDSGSFTWYIQASQTPKTISYSTDEGQTWTELTAVQNPTPINMAAGDRIMLKGEITSTYDSYYATFAYFRFNLPVDVQGNIMSLINGDNFAGVTTLTSDNTFTNLFYQTSSPGDNGVINAKNLVLPATTLTSGCYRGLFGNNHNLTSAPNLPATTLTEYCYNGMFSGCTSLTTAPNLPATNLATDCYNYMFGTSGLTQEANIPDELAPLSITYCDAMYCQCPITTPNGKYHSDAYGCPTG